MCVQARLQAEDLEQLPPRFRTQEESLRRLHYPSSFALRCEPGAAGLPDAVGQQLAAVSRAVAQAYPQEHLSMAALPEVGSATRTPRLGAAAAHSARPPAARFVAAPPPAADGGGQGAGVRIKPPQGRRLFGRQRRYSDGGTPRGLQQQQQQQQQQMLMVPRPPAGRRQVALPPSGPGPKGGKGRARRVVGGRFVRPTPSQVVQSAVQSVRSKLPPEPQPQPEPEPEPESQQEPEPEPEPEQKAKAKTKPEPEPAPGTEADFDAELALMQLEWPQPLGAVRSEGELAPLNGGESGCAHSPLRG